MVNCHENVKWLDVISRDPAVNIQVMDASVYLMVEALRLSPTCSRL